jgi:hypothetical protein
VRSFRRIVTAPFFLLAVALSASFAASGDDLITLAKSGVDEEVVKAYIENTAGPFDLTPAEVIALKDLGVSSKLIIEALRHERSGDSLLNADTAAANPESTAVQTVPAAVSPVTAPPPQEQDISFFYTALSPYGTWIDVDGNWCWQPNASNLDEEWTPYCNHGRWELTDYGWTWVSSYTWGWAPFHYGRWFRRDYHGWLWQPDNEWGPAWVAWRTSGDFCGWAPLPPRAGFEARRGFFFGATIVNDDADFGLSFGDFTFVPMEHFHDRHPFGHVVPAVMAPEVYRKTAFEKKGFSYVNNHIINEGVPVSAVEKASRTRIRAVVLTEEHVRQGEPIHAGTVSANKLTIYKPALSKAAPLSPLAIKERFTKNAAGFGKMITPASNPQSWETLQKTQKKAAEQAVKSQQAAARTAQMERNRLDQEAQKETDPAKLAALKGEEAVQTKNVQRSQRRSQRVQLWNPPQEIIVPKPPQPAQQVSSPVRAEAKPVAGNKVQAPLAQTGRPMEQFRNQVREINSEAQGEQQHRQTIESAVRTQAKSQVPQQQRQPARQQEPPHKK